MGDRKREMGNGELHQLVGRGVVVVPSVLDSALLQTLNERISPCFDAIEEQIRDRDLQQIQNTVPAFYHFNPWVTSVKVAALDAEKQTDCQQKLLQALAHAQVASLLQEVMGEALLCNLTQSWVRKQYAPAHYHAWHHAHTWHQDGALEVQFDPDHPAEQFYTTTPCTPLITCWLPLTPCGRDRPGLEFITHPQTQLLHYQHLHDITLRERFAPEEFWAPSLEPGDAVVFLNGTLHRTHTHAEMTGDRTSVELRFVQRDRIPAWMESDQFLPL